MGNLSFDFTDRTVIVTGAARGIGLEVSRAFSQASARVVMVDFDGEVLGESAAEVGAIPVQADVSRTEDVERVVGEAMEQTGRVDILVNNAGILRDRVLWKMTDDEWESVLAVHAGGTFRFTRAVVPIMREQGYGRIINVTSFTGLHGNVGQANYATAKAGIIGLTKTSAKELAQFGITVNAISPQAATRMTASIPAELVPELTGPIARFADPSEIASALEFLAAEESGFITGVVLPVDGGVSI